MARIARTSHFSSRAKITSDDTITDGESVRGEPMDRLLAVLARLISQRSFKEECVSEVAKVPLRAAVCANGAAVLPSAQRLG